jgi:hypothetical protein
MTMQKWALSSAFWHDHVYATTCIFMPICAWSRPNVHVYALLHMSMPNPHVQAYLRMFMPICALSYAHLRMSSPIGACSFPFSRVQAKLCMFICHIAHVHAQSRIRISPLCACSCPVAHTHFTIFEYGNLRIFMPHCGCSYANLPMYIPICSCLCPFAHGHAILHMFMPNCACSWPFTHVHAQLRIHISLVCAWFCALGHHHARMSKKMRKWAWTCTIWRVHAQYGHRHAQYGQRHAQYGHRHAQVGMHMRVWSWPCANGHSLNTQYTFWEELAQMGIVMSSCKLQGRSWLSQLVEMSLSARSAKVFLKALL